MRYNIIVLLFLTSLATDCSGDYPEYDQFSTEPSYLDRKDESVQEYYDAYNEAMKLFPVDYKELYVPTRFGEAHVLVSGPADGEPLVLLHGMNASSVMWYPNIEAFTKKFRVFAIDLFVEPGKSVPADEFKGTKDIMKWYFDVFDTLQLESFYLIGASRGGWLATQLALENRVEIRKMILLSPAQTFELIEPQPKLLSHMIYDLAPDKAKTEEVLKDMSTNVDGIDERFMNLFYQANKVSDLSRSVFEMKPLAPIQAKNLDMSVLVLIGEDDIINSRATLRRAKRLLPNADTSVIEGAGHFLSLDQASQVNQMMMDFLSK